MALLFLIQQQSNIVGEEKLKYLRRWIVSRE